MSRLSATEGEFSVHEAGGTLYASWRCTDRRVWEQVKSSFRSTFPHWTAVRYAGQWRAWAVPLRQRHRLATWADAWFVDAAQRWDEDSDDCRTGAREQRGWGEVATAPISALGQAYAVLHLLQSALPELVQAACRIAIRQAHPDAGGKHGDAVTVNAAIATIRAHQQQPVRHAVRSPQRERAAS